MSFSGNEVHSNSSFWPFVVHIPAGHKSARSARQLAEELRMSEDEVRELVRGARLDGFLICESCDGFFVPEAKYEFQQWYREQLRELNCLSRILQSGSWAFL